jgi:hypothetical protein
MKEKLVSRFREHIQENYPELLLHLLEENRLEDYLHEQINSIELLINELTRKHSSASVIEDLCIDELTRVIRPSRYNYLHDLLQDEFGHDYERLLDKGTLTTELINMIPVCEPVFEELKFSDDNEDDMYIRYAVMGAVHEYLNREA